MKAILFDIDGTTLLGEEALPGAVEIFREVRARNIPHLWLTNNTSLSREGWYGRLAAAGLEPELSQIYTAGEATIDHLRGLDPVPSICLVGTRALRDAFRSAGLVVVADGEPADVVVLGYDTELTYGKVRAAALLLQQGVPFFATHPDKTCPSPQGALPDVGSFIAMFEAACARTPVVLGKPQPAMVEGALARLGVSAADTVMVGDRLETDIRMANAAGMASILVMTGVTTSEQVLASGDRSTWTFASLADVRGWLEDVWQTA